MVCPYAKVTGLLKKKVICTLVNSEINYSKYPCLRGNYRECPIYKEAHGEGTQAKVIIPKGEEAKPKEPMEKMVDDAARSVKKFYDPKKGEKPPSCYDCLYFSPTTRMCLLLRKKITNPEKPECQR